MTNKEKFLALVSEQDNSVLEKIKWRIENRAWLRRSQSIALKILLRLDEINITQKELAERMGVSAQMVNKLVKGSENITLETISKLEKALGMELIQVNGYEKVESAFYQNDDIVEYDNIPLVSDFKSIHTEAKIIPLESKYSTWGNKYNNAV
jgi:transcriptional regulator with XRE-family HTH domain